MDIAYKRPLTYFTVPETERPKRVQENDNYLIIDKDTFIVRGILCLPVHELNDDFCFGVWAVVDEQTFSDIWQLREVDGTGKVFDGGLDGDIRVYPDTLDTPLEVHLQPKGQRPRFLVKDADSPLGSAQKDGISIDRVHEIQHEFFGRSD